MCPHDRPHGGTEAIEATVYSSVSCILYSVFCILFIQKRNIMIYKNKISRTAIPGYSLIPKGDHHQVRKISLTAERVKKIRLFTAPAYVPATLQKQPALANASEMHCSNTPPSKPMSTCWQADYLLPCAPAHPPAAISPPPVSITSLTSTSISASIGSNAPPSFPK